MITLKHISIARTFPLPLSRRQSTNRQVHVLLAAIAALCLAPTTSISQEQVPLTPDSVIGGDGCKIEGVVRPVRHAVDDASNVRCEIADFRFGTMTNMKRESEIANRKPTGFTLVVTAGKSLYRIRLNKAGYELPGSRP